MIYYILDIAMKDKNGDIYPCQVAAPSLAKAIDFLTKETGLTYAYKIHSVSVEMVSDTILGLSYPSTRTANSQGD